jgi:hypothetical protein
MQRRAVWNGAFFIAPILNDAPFETALFLLRQF